jgi:hypothetical protein
MSREELIINDIKKLLFIKGSLESFQKNKPEFEVLKADNLDIISIQSVLNHLKDLILELGNEKVKSVIKELVDEQRDRKKAEQKDSSPGQ